MEENFLDSDYRFGDLSSGPKSLRVVDSSNPGDASHFETSFPSAFDPFNFPDIGRAAALDEPWGASWGPEVINTKNELPPATVATNGVDMEGNKLRKQLLKLDLGLIEDLDLLESGSIISATSSLLKEDISPVAEKLDLPIVRMLNASAQFLEIIQSRIIGCSESTELPAFETGQKECTVQDDQRHLITKALETSIEDGVITASSSDSGYLTMTTSPSGHSKTLSSSNRDMSTALSMLVTYCHLVRVYRSVFMHLYQLFLIIPPADAAAFLLLPNLHFGQFHTDGGLATQAQMLIERSSNLLSEIERALGMSCGSVQELEGGMTPSEPVLGDSPMALIRKQIMAEEHLEYGVSLKETINCLRHLLKDTAGL